ncbi:transposase [Sinorhizobium medicae]|nr:transposase [Sinorhizobium medicae]MQU79359.1 transposase [Sinorhizobium medicae]
MMEKGQKLVVRLVGRNGPRRFDPAPKDRLIAACLKPGASVSNLALEHGVSANLVCKWIRNHTQARPFPPSSTSAFLPVQITAASSKFALEMPATDGEELPPKGREDRAAVLSSEWRRSASRGG